MSTSISYVKAGVLNFLGSAPAKHTTSTESPLHSCVCPVTSMPLPTLMYWK